MKHQKQKNSIITQMLSVVVLYSLVFTSVFASQMFAQTQVERTNESSMLSQYTTDSTQLAYEGRIQPKAGLETEVNALIKSLVSGKLQQPVILDDKGESQELIVDQLASRIATKNVPANLYDTKVLRLEVASLFSNLKNSEEASIAVESIFNELSETDGKVILFVDELTNFAGNSQINNALTNALLQGKVKIIGGSSEAAYQEDIAPVAQVAALFEPITIGKQANSNKVAVNKEGFRGDSVSPDLREMIEKNPGGEKRLDVIIQAKDADNPTLRAIMAEHKVRLQDRIGTTDTIVVNLPLSAVEAIAQSGIINYMSPDRPVKLLGHVEDAIGANLVRNQGSGNSSYTLDGTGVGIAILDSGMAENHKAFKRPNNTSRIVHSQSFVPSEPSADDEFGHGTHVGGIAAGSINRNNGAYRGVAPNADIINLKVLDGNGTGQSSWLLNAFDWLINNHQTYNIRVVNLSLGGTAIDTYTNDVVCRKVQDLNALGVLVVAAAGNEGKSPDDGHKMYGHIHSPGNDPSALTVGAVNTKNTNARTDDAMASFSSRGPTRSFYTNTLGQKVYDHAIKPDVVAPGNKIISARSKPSSYLVTHYPSLYNAELEGVTDDEDMLSMSGTSMATPVVAGAAALLFQENPNLTPQMVKMIFEYTAQPINGYNLFEQGAGQINLEGAVRLAKTYRKDINFNANATSGMSLLATGQSFPNPQTTLNGQTFNWSQGILTNRTALSGQSLASKFHNVYKNDSWFEKGITKTITGNYTLNTKFSAITSIGMNADIVTSDGSTLGNGSVFANAAVLISDGVVVSDGVLFGDGVLVSDGVYMSDGVLAADGVLASDRSAQSSIATLHGDD